MPWVSSPRPVEVLVSNLRSSEGVVRENLRCRGRDGLGGEAVKLGSESSAPARSAGSPAAATCGRPDTMLVATKLQRTKLLEVLKLSEWTRRPKQQADQEVFRIARLYAKDPARARPSAGRREKRAPPRRCTGDGRRWEREP